MKKWRKFVCLSCLSTKRSSQDESDLTQIQLDTVSTKSSTISVQNSGRKSLSRTVSVQKKDEETSLKISSPYILISDCYSGLSSKDVRSKSFCAQDTVEVCGAKTARSKSETRFQGDHRSLDTSVPEEVRISSLRLEPQSDLVVLPPERPPKPSYLIHAVKHNNQETIPENYANSSDMQKLYFQETNNNNNNKVSEIYSRDRVLPCPEVQRDTKPGRDNFLAGSKPNLNQIFATIGPPVERSLKPHNKRVSGVSRTMPKLWSNNEKVSELSRKDSFEEDEQIYYYMTPANTSTAHGWKNSPLIIPADTFEHPSLAYIDLDLPKVDPDDSTTHLIGQSNFKQAVDHSSTIYKTIDIEKTEAFNRTRRDIESQRLKNEAKIVTSSKIF